MKVVIAGGHGKIALHLTRLLAARGDGVRSLIRNPAHEEELRAAGAEPVVCDLESASVADVADAIGTGDAVVFAAGAGPGSGPERKLTMDRDGAIKLIDAAEAKGFDHYVMVSAMSADAGHQGDDTFSVYLRAKGEADAALEQAAIRHTIVRPGLLTDDPGTGHIEAGREVKRAAIPREDVATTLLAVLDVPGAVGLTFNEVTGDVPIADAIAALAGAP